MKKIIKRILFGTRTKEYEIIFGIGKGVRMNIDPMHKSQRILGLDEKEIQHSFKEFAIAADCFIDVGASDGYYGLLYKKFNNLGKVFLFDLDPNFRQEQLHNFELNGIPFATIYSSDAHVSSRTDGKFIALQDIIDSELGKYFIKIDVDGGEMDVLSGLKEFLIYNNCVLIIETHELELEKRCIEFMNQLGYKSTIIFNAWYRNFIPELRPIAHNRWLRCEK